MLAIGGDMLLLGYAIAALDAYDEGEMLLRDALRSLVACAAGILLFGGQVLAVMAIEGVSDSLVLLLIALITTIIVLQVFRVQWRNLLDKLVFAESPELQQSRAQLTAAAEALPRAPDAPDFGVMDEAEFTRLTRRALANLSNLDRLVTSPLMHLPLIDARLSHNGRDTTLERAAELKAILTESIMRLKPREGDTGTTDEWRYYNALYFPYVMGLKPYSRRLLLPDLSPEERSVAEWFRVQVPERTLYNWQNKAAELIAQELREQVAGL